MKKFAIIGKPERSQVKKLAEKLLKYAAKGGVEVTLDSDLKAYDIQGSYEYRNRDKLCEGVCCLFVLGGDGTLLHGAKAALPYGATVVGINLGGLGFLTEISPNELDEILPKLEKEELPCQERYIFRATHMSQGKKLGSWLVVNDVVIHKGALARIIGLSAYKNGALVNKYRADGLIVATPTGSTAYSLSAGGPIIEPGFDGALLTPISPHTLSNRPLLLHEFNQLKVKLEESNGTVYLTLDGQEGIQLSDDDEIIVERVDKKLKLICSPDKTFFEILRTKLKWGQSYHHAT